MTNKVVQNKHLSSPKPHRVPYDLSYIDTRENWRDDFSWPISPYKSVQINSPIPAAIAEGIRQIEDKDVRQIAEISGIRICMTAITAVHAAYIADTAELKGIDLVAEQPEFQYLKGNIKIEEIPDTYFKYQFRVQGKTKLSWLYSLAKPRYWTPWYRLPLTVIAPRATVVNRNDLLVGHAYLTNERLNYLDAPSIFNDAFQKVRKTDVDSDVINAAADILVRSIVIPENISDQVRNRLMNYLLKHFYSVCERSALNLVAARRMPKLPSHVWNATAGHLPGAMIAWEVLRRGGQVTGFDHPSGRGVEKIYPLTVLGELTFCSSFVLPTPSLAKRFEDQNPHLLQCSGKKTKIIGSNGYPDIRRANLMDCVKRSPSQKLRVTYVSPMFRGGWRQNVPAVTPDPVQLDWELRLIKILKQLPIELIGRPHPDDIYHGKIHPLSSEIKISNQYFEALIPNTDLFLMDYFRSTTFWTALCTNRPIVMIELGYSYRDVFFTDEIRSALEQRVRFVRAESDDRNRLIIDPDELTDAIMNAPATFDASEFQRLIIGKSLY